MPILIGLAGDLGLTNLSLIAVNGSEGFWARFGFEIVDGVVPPAKLASYEDSARFIVLRL